MIRFWFDGWESIVRTLVVGSLGYFCIVGLLRVSGKRTLAQMNVFDFVITVALGATFGGVLTSRDVTLAEAVTAFVVLVGWQYVVSVLRSRSRAVSSWLTSDPVLLVHEGAVIERALRRQRLNVGQVEAAVRRHGYGSLEDVAAAVLESDGSVSVIGRDGRSDGSALPGAP